MAALAIRSLLKVLFGLGESDRGSVSVDATDDSLFGTQLLSELLAINRDMRFLGDVVRRAAYLWIQPGRFQARWTDR